MPNAAYQTPTTSASPASRQPAMRDAGTGSSVTARSESPSAIARCLRAAA